MGQLISAPFEAPIRLHPTKFWSNGAQREVLYAGYKVPHANKLEQTRVGRGQWTPKANRNMEADYRDTDPHELFDLMSRCMENPPVVGTHGFLTFEEHKPAKTICLTAIAVPKRFQGSGVAQKLLDRAVRLAKARQAIKLCITTERRSQGYHLAKNNGFRVTAYNPHRPNLVRMERQL